MNKQKFESIWKMLSENNFEVNEDIHTDYLCTICRKLLIEACSAPCGCRYCKACITDYLKDVKKICPGNSEYCKDDEISFDCDILVDQAINTRISRLIVKCPNTNCQRKVDIKSMENHLETCENRCVSCPFINIGCEDNTLKSDKINEHLLSEVHSHTKLLMEWVNISRNETAMLKNSIDQLSEEMTKLRNENRLLKGELQDLQDEHRLERASNLEFRKKVETQIQEIDQLKRECQMKETRLDEKLESQQRKNDEIDITLNEISLLSSAMEKKSNKTIQSIDDIQESIIKLNYGDFVWKIDGWAEKRIQAKIGTNQEIFSNPFFSFKNSYKMCLRVHPDGFGPGKETYLSVFYCIIRGNYDEILRWPFKHDVELSLMNQKSGLVHSSMMLQYSDQLDSNAFSKPISEKNIGFGYPQFIKHDEILTIPGLYENDQIVVRCRVKLL